jgi:hypothetical protein
VGLGAVYGESALAADAAAALEDRSTLFVVLVAGAFLSCVAD